MMKSPMASCVIPDAKGERESIILCKGKQFGLIFNSKMDPRSAARLGMTRATFWRAPLLAGLALFIASPAAVQGAGSSSPYCRREIFFTDGAMVASQRKLQDNAAAKPAELCAVWRGHVEVLKKSVASYQRCASAQERASKLNPAQTSLQEFNEVLKSRCKGI